MTLIEKIHSLVSELMSGAAGHGVDHIDRVYNYAMKFQSVEGGDRDIIGIAALLHDVDDHKFFGDESEKNMTNAKRIMDMVNVDENTRAAVLDIISQTGYSKYLAGIRMKTLEGKIVSDADMADAGGAMVVVRTAQYYEQRGLDFFNRNTFPNVDNINSDAYRKRDSNTGINHYFEKILKLKNVMYTESGRRAAEYNREFDILFLRRFFAENNAPEWIEFLDKYLETNP